MYLTYEEYQDYGGELDETTFNEYAFEAGAQIDWYTFNRLSNETEFGENVKRCMYYLIKLIQDATAARAVPTVTGTSSSNVTPGIQSQSNDGVSISYMTVSASEILHSIEGEIELCIKKYLQGVKNSLGQKVLYRGIYPNE